MSGYPEKISIDSDLSYYSPISSQRELDKMNWLAKMEHSEAGLMMQRPRDMLHMLFSIVVEYDSGQRIKKLINERLDRPFFYKCLAGDWHNSQVIPYLLLGDDTVLIGMYALIHFEARTDGIWNDWARQRKQARTQEIWEEGLSFLAYALHKQPVGRGASLILELVEWFYRELRKPVLHSSVTHNRRKEQLDRILGLLLEMPRYAGSQDLLIEELLPEFLDRLQAGFASSDCPLGEELWPFMLWLMEQRHEGNLQDVNDLLSRFSERMVDFYIDSFGNQSSYDRWIEVIEKEIESPGWLFAAEHVFKRNEMLWIILLNPADFESMVQSNSFLEKYSQRQKVGKIRSHIRLLSYFTVHLENKEMTEDVSPILSRLVLQFQQDKTEDGRVDIFQSHLEFNPIIGYLGANVPLFERASTAINAFSDRKRVDILQELIQMPIDISRLGTLYSAMSREKDKQVIIQAINQSSVEMSLDSVHMLTDIQDMVTKLLNIGNKEMALMSIDIMDRQKKVVKERRLHDWMEWEFRERLRAQFILGNGDEILHALIPKELEGRESVQRARDFYQGLVLLNSEDEDNIKMAIRIFRDLRKNKPEIVSYGINLIAANVRLLEQQVKAADKDTDKVKRLVRELNQLFEEVQSDDRYGTEILIENRLFMFTLIGDWEAFWNVYASLPADLKMYLKIGLYAVQVYGEQREWEKAEALLQKLKQIHGSNDSLQRLETEIKEKRPVALFVAPSPSLDPYDWKGVGSAKITIRSLSLDYQAKAYFNSEHARVRDILLAEMFQACSQLKRMAPTLIKYVDNDKGSRTKQGKEDHYNDILAILLDQSIRLLGWSATTQSRGGFTENQGIGERDIVIKDGNNREITIVEALRLQSADEKNIRKHFRKIFRYDAGDANFNFLITWGFSDKPKELWEKYKSIVLSSTDGDFPVIKEGSLKDQFPLIEEPWPLSFYTKHYSDIGEEIYIIHLYVDVKMRGKW
ncbi:hypothetical protein P4U23_16355 [Aeribacillus composti]|uniref:hypothetical protein n=1 Tax=Aeribacillus composti TaxID=1868734 RepID=UPI002E1BFB99|nr:hypothetical protein [Aeribacillus composti]